MRRADRLFEIIQILRRNKTTRAADIAVLLEVSERTIYRDIRDMMSRGVPIDGEAGVGYILRPDFNLPPLMFQENEIEALLLGTKMVQSWADPELGKAAASAIEKIGQVMPDKLRRQLELVNLWTPTEPVREPITIDQAELRRAIRHKRMVHFTYRDLKENVSERLARPLIMAFYGQVWLLAAWCETRDGFRVFRVDRMSQLRSLDERFRDEPGRTAEDFLKQDTKRF
ncbi:helix-turn-helix transcriptional regulator [Rhizobium sp. BK456]|uniref:helix-turn-helix transcriptional regulator n=1 Tax=Rhizobium sp. BK456 TaxID=2587007 RepID=UPI001610A0B6|nr:YafY family protein [Rhizobium sp. BK456]MBB3526948.1 putative DNA-binding transcriptional regulator YafY [Rhizobium sp. BK456]